MVSDSRSIFWIMRLVFLYPYSSFSTPIHCWIIFVWKKKRNPELLSDLFGIIVVCIGDYVAIAIARSWTSALKLRDVSHHLR